MDWMDGSSFRLYRSTTTWSKVLLSIRQTAKQITAAVLASASHSPDSRVESRVREETRVRENMVKTLWFGVSSLVVLPLLSYSLGCSNQPKKLKGFFHLWKQSKTVTRIFATFLRYTLDIYQNSKLFKIRILVKSKKWHFWNTECITFGVEQVQLGPLWTPI